MPLLNTNTASLYLHVPFCRGACDYCDFYSLPAAGGDIRLGQYIDRVLRDTAMLFEKFPLSHMPTAYIGGGTPSVLGAAGISRLLRGIEALLPNKPEEFTVEANPESADEAFLAACREGGVNRLSLGVQSFHEPSRKAVHRIGEASVIPRRLSLLAEYFPLSFSADLISGLPYQDETVLLRDIEKLLSFKPAHVSLYALTVEEGTPLAEKLKGVSAGEGAPPREEEADRLWLAGRDALEKAGYAQYEVSNFSLPGKESRHNIRYWLMENWLAAGPAASMTMIRDESGTALRYTARADLDEWLQREGRENRNPVPPSLFTEEILDPLTLMKETLLMGFRYIGGPSPALFRKRFGHGIEEAIPGTLAAWRRRGLVRREEAALTREGLLLLNPFLVEAFGEIEGKK